MAHSDTEKTPPEGVRSEIDETVEKQSIQETQTLIAFFRIYHWLCTFNQTNDLQPSESGAITLSDDILKSVAYGFIKPNPRRPQTFIIHLQQHEYSMFNELTLQAAWLEHQALCVMFAAIKFADYLIPPLKLSFKIASPKVYKKLQTECQFATIALINESQITPNKYTVSEVKNPVAPLLKAAPTKQTNTKQFAKVFT